MKRYLLSIVALITIIVFFQNCEKYELKSSASIENLFVTDDGGVTQVDVTTNAPWQAQAVIHILNDGSLEYGFRKDFPKMSYGWKQENLTPSEVTGSEQYWIRVDQLDGDLDLDGHLLGIWYDVYGSEATTSLGFYNWWIVNNDANSITYRAQFSLRIAPDNGSGQPDLSKEVIRKFGFSIRNDP